MTIKNRLSKLPLSFLLLLLVVLSSTQTAQAMGKFEKLISNPLHAFLIILGGAGAIVAILFFSSWLAGLRRPRKTQSTKGGARKMKPEDARKLYSQIPAGEIGDILLPPAKLIRKDKDSDSQTIYTISLDKELMIGRDEANDVAIEMQAVSMRHAKIRPENDGYMLYDLISTGGTCVNEKEVMRHLLEDGDVIRIGHSDLTFNQSYPGKERRKLQRVEVGSEVRYLIHSPEGSASEGHCHSTNLSASGIHLRTEKQFSRGAILELEIKIPEFPAISAIGEVRWSNLEEDTYETGVEFTSIDKKDVDKITAYIHKKWETLS